MVRKSVGKYRGARAAIVRLARACGLQPRVRTHDRTLLEGTILPWLAGEPWVRQVLFVGCAWYTWHYQKAFAAKEYWTIEINPEEAEFGSPGRHVVDSLTNLDAHFQPDSLDAIVCNGVIGWGLNGPADIEQAMAACRRCLRPGGVLVIGWNDEPEHRPVPLTEVDALQQFEPWDFPGMGPVFLTENPNRHTFSFYRKVKAAGRTVAAGALGLVAAGLTGLSENLTALDALADLVGC